MSSTNNLSTELIIDTKQVDNAIDRLITKFDKLSSSIMKISDTSVKKIAKGVQQATTNTSQLTSEFNRLADAMAKVASASQSIDFASTTSNVGEGIDVEESMIGTIKSIVNAVKTCIGNVEKLGSAWEKIKTLLSGGLVEEDGLFAKLINAFALTAGGAGTLRESLLAIFGKTGVIGAVISGAVLGITNFISMLQDGFSWLNEILMVIGIAIATVGAIILGVSAWPAIIVGAIVAALATIVIVVKDNWDAICNWFAGVGEWFNTNVITPVVNFFKGLWETVSGYFSGLWESISSVWLTVSTWFSENVITPVVSLFEGIWLRIGQIFEGLWIIIQAIWIIVSTWFNENVITPVVGFFQGLWESVSGFFSSLWENIQGVWTVVSTWFNENVIIPVVGFFQGLWESISGFFSSLWEDIKTIWSNASNWFNTNVVQPITAVFDAIWSGIKSAMAEAMNGIIGGIESAINFIIKGINNIIRGFNDVVDWAAEVVGTEWGGVTLLNEVKLSRIEGYELGGFPDRASLFWAGENGVPELMGTVGGRTAVAGGAEITGIRDEIRKTANEEMIILKQQNQLLQAILQKEFGITTNDIGKSARAYAREYFIRTGNEAYSF